MSHYLQDCDALGVEGNGRKAQKGDFMNDTGSEAYRKARNDASDVFQRYFPHVPLLDDEDSAMPPVQAAFRRNVVEAIVDALIAQRKSIGREVAAQKFIVTIGTNERRSSVDFPIGRDVAAFILEDLHLYQPVEKA